MQRLVACADCGGFLAPRGGRCPHCGARSERLLRLAAAIAAATGGGLIAMTLMACYGGPPCGPADDADRDGYPGSFCSGPNPRDCNDTDPSIHPGAADPFGDGIDQNCDGVDGIAPPPGLGPDAGGGTTDAATDASADADADGKPAPRDGGKSKDAGKTKDGG